MSGAPHRHAGAPRNAAAAVSVHIERLVLDGFSLSPAQGAQMQRALKRELARLAAGAPAGAWASGAVPVALAPPVRTAGTLRPAQLGREVARSLFAALGAQA